jgi:hypothetical protein
MFVWLVTARVLICSKIKILLAGSWWQICFERKVLLVDKLDEHSIV